MSDQKFLQDLDKKLWKSANKLLPSLDAAVYKHVVLGMVFVKYVSDSFEARREEIKQDFVDPEHDYFLGDDVDDEFINEELENRDYYKEKNIFWVPQAARWQYLQDNIRLSNGSPLPLKGGEFKGASRLLDDTMVLIEKENPRLKRLLKKDYAQLQIDETKLADLLDLIATIPFSHGTLHSKDILGHVYEYFLGQFASAEGKKGGQFYTPKSIVNLMVEMVEPLKGRVYDPAMGSGGFFISSEKFIEEHQGKIGNISVYGQESNPTTWRLAAMNMAIRGIDFNFGKEPADTFSNDQHPDLRADFVLANPPFNQNEWWHGSLEDDARWKYGTPPQGNGNFAWLQHMLHHTSPNGVVGLVLSNGSLNTITSGEKKIREAIIKDDLVEAIVALPSQLFSNTQIPACIWVLSKNKAQKGKTLFIYANEMGFMLDRKHRDFKDKDIKGIADTFHAFRSGSGYEDVLGKFYVATTEEITKYDYILTPGQYVGAAEKEDDDAPFSVNLTIINTFLKANTRKQQGLDNEISRIMEEAFPNFDWGKISFSSNEILESMAQAIFKSWFVDFDPVHAKAGATSDDELEQVAKELGISRKVLDLFPSEFEESELGFIPRGWRVVNIGDCSLIIESGRRPKGGIDKALISGVPSVGAESIAPIGTFDYSKVKYVTDDFALKVSAGRVKEMDVALYKDGGKPGQFIPRVSMYGENYPFENFMVNEHVFLLRSSLLGQIFLFYLVSSPNFLGQIIFKGSAKAAQPGLNQAELRSTQFILPSKKLLQTFNRQIEPIVKKQLDNGKQYQTLQKIRDTLLPKLLSGELDVSNLDLELTDD